MLFGFSRGTGWFWSITLGLKGKMTVFLKTSLIWCGMKHWSMADDNTGRREKHGLTLPCQSSFLAYPKLKAISENLDLRCLKRAAFKGWVTCVVWGGNPYSSTFSVFARCRSLRVRSLSRLSRTSKAGHLCTFGRNTWFKPFVEQFAVHVAVWWGTKQPISRNTRQCKHFNCLSF